ncbi:endonuclease/exonuclease/phosphatase family protein [Kribbella sp. NPDC056345]|uniref:endonuclease/exonuclease/phosphatase family protein n=1 Tax=Kribbella sp. NPDC056345 TaxID=3345789 RepID=UPI0035D99355
MTDHQVRVMTWNIWWRFGPRWRERQPGILETIRRFTPDVVGLQEVWGTRDTTQAEELADALDMHAAFAAPSYPAADRSDVELGVALLSRWPIAQYDGIAMPSRHRAWDPVVLKAAVDHPAGRMPVLVACLEHATTYSDDRLAQATLLADLATDPSTDGPCPSLAIGDLNAAADSAVLRPLREVLIDAWTAGGGAADAITLPSSHPSAPLEAGPELVDQRIDHIFYRPGHEDQLVTVESAKIAGDPYDGVYPSDHRPVICDLRWRDR